MWQTIKKWAIEYGFMENVSNVMIPTTDYAQMASFAHPPEMQLLATPDVIVAALNHDCATCKRGFKTVGATGAHKRLKHKKT